MTEYRSARERAAEELHTEVRAWVKPGPGEYIHCPRAKSSMSPCVVRDGWVATADDGTCVSCWGDPVALLAEFHDRRGQR